MEGTPDPRTDGELLVATADDAETFGVFCRRHVRGVLAFFHRRTRAQRRRARVTLRPGALTAVAVTLIVAAGLLLALDGRDRPAAGTTTATPPAAHRSLRSSLAVLRRPRTAADRLPPRWRGDNIFGVYDLAAVRMATVTP